MFKLQKQHYFLLTLVLVPLVLYFGFLGNDFVSDDLLSIVNNPNIGTPANFVSHELIYSFVYNVFGLNPFVFRLLNNLIPHILTVLVLFMLVKEFCNERVAFITALLFSLHPLLSESVFWISGGIYVHRALLTFLVLLFYIRSKEDSKYLYFTGFLVGLSVFFMRDRAVLLPLMLIFYEIAFGNVKKDYKRMLILVGLLVSFGVLISLPSSKTRATSLELDTFVSKDVYRNPFVHVPVAVRTYLQNIAWPTKISFFHHWENIRGGFNVKEYVINYLVSLGYLAGLIWVFLKNKTLFFWMSFFLIMISISLIPWVNAFTVADRYAYPAAAGVFFVIGYFLDLLLDNAKYKKVVLVVFIAWVLVLSAFLINRGKDWKNDETLYRSIEKVYPNNIKNQLLLRDVYKMEGDYEKALEQCKLALKMEPRGVYSNFCLCDTYTGMGEINLAIKACRTTVSIQDTFWKAHKNLAAMYLDAGDFEKALASIDRALKVQENDYQLYGMKGVVLLNMGDTSSAVSHFKKALKINPGDKISRQYLSIISAGN
jgi:protein O-mannosyl-transferase